MKRKAKQHSVRISLCMIARDEERWLADSLNSVKLAVDEVVLVDTGSRDSTREIAAAAGAKVIEMPWQKDFSLARNESLRHATGDWVLIMDADEVLVSPGSRPIHEAVGKYPGAMGLTVQFRHRVSDLDPFLHTNTQGLRLFRRLPGVQFEGAIHEQVNPSIERHGGQIAHSGLTFEHFGYLPSLRNAKQKDQRNTSLLREQIAATPNNLFARLNLATEHMMSQRFQEARDEYERAWQMATDQDREAMYFPKLARDRARAALLLKEVERGLQQNEEALALYPDYPDLWLDRARLLIATNQYDTALEALDRALAITKVNPRYTTDGGANSWDAWFHRGIAHEGTGRMLEAAADYQWALKAHPAHRDSALRLAYIGSHGESEELVGRVEAALSHAPHGPELITQMHYQTHQFARAGAWAEKAPLTGAVALARTAARLLAGESQEAARSLEQAVLTREQQRDARYLRVFIAWAEDRWEEARLAAQSEGSEDAAGQVLELLTETLSGRAPSEPVPLHGTWLLVLTWLLDLHLFDLFDKSLEVFRATPGAAWQPSIGKILHLRGHDALAVEFFAQAGRQALDPEALGMLAEIAEGEGLQDDAQAFRRNTPLPRNSKKG